MQQIAFTLNNHIPDKIKENLEKEISSMKSSIKKVNQIKDSLNKKENELKESAQEKEKYNKELRDKEEIIKNLQRELMLYKEAIEEVEKLNEQKQILSQMDHLSKIKKRNLAQDFSSDISKILSALKQTTPKNFFNFHQPQNSELLSSSFYKKDRIPPDVSLSFLKTHEVNETPDFRS